MNIKYIKRIDTTNKTNTYIDGETIEFVLPRNKIDLSSLKFYFDVDIDPVYEYTDNSYLKRFMPRLTSSIIDTMTITKDGEEFQTIKDYNVIFNIINDATKEVDDVDSDRPDTLNYCFIDNDNNAKKICDFNNSTNNTVLSPIKYRCFITSFLGFLGEHSSSILDCSKHEYKIAVTLAPKYITYRGIENTSVKVSFSGGGGSGATATANLSKSVSYVSVTNSGINYTSVPTVVIAGGGGINGAATATMSVGSVTVTNGGAGYTLEPIITFTGGGGTGASASAVLNGDAVAAIIITNEGTGYTTPPTINFTGGGGGTGVAATSRLKVQRINVTNAGTAYTSTPTVTITGGGGTGATATAALVCSVSSITVNNGGSGYYSTPFISISGGEPSSHAVATATINGNGVITGINVLDGGSGYADNISVFSVFPEDYHYKLTNVFANIDVLPDSTPASSQITFKHYKTIKGTNNNTKNTTLSHKHKGPLNYLMSSFIVLGENDTGLQLASCNTDTTKFGEYFKDCYGDIFAYEDTPMTSKTASSKTAKNISTENNLDNSLYFKRVGSNIKSSQFFINGQAITPSMDIPQIYNVAKEFFNNDMSRVKSLASFENEFFVFPMMINQTQEEYSSEIEWICTAGNRQDFKAYPILILCTDKTIEV